MKIRTYPESNYKAIFFNGKTIRQKINDDLPFKVTKTPEIEDVAINSKCFAQCSYCYTSATKKGTNFENIIQKAKDVWGILPENERPFPIAIGGAGESTIHPDWVEFVKTVKELGIVPNYTTNGMHLSESIIQGTIDYCGGVAVSYHPHIKDIYNKAIQKLSILKDNNVKLNTHVIVGSEESYFDLQYIYETYKDTIDYFVILPYQVAGRAEFIDTNDVWLKTFQWISELPEYRQSQFAFGALFYDWMKDKQLPLKMSIYEPELFSGYRLLDDTYKMLRASSYNLTEKIIK